MRTLLSITWFSQLGSGVGCSLFMKRIPLPAAGFALAALIVGATPSFAAEPDGVAVAIIYDTSGSMRETVPGRGGQAEPKYQIANRALIAVAGQLRAYATNAPAGAPRNLHAGLFIFQGAGARAVIPLGPLDADALEKWAGGFTRPDGNTPLGNALNAAGQAVLRSPLPRKHVLVITDGMNTAGPRPEVVLPALQKRAAERGAGVSVHFVAFDVDAKVFEPVKKLGATVVGAADEQQLNAQLDYILQKKILLEDEEPRK